MYYNVDRCVAEGCFNNDCLVNNDEPPCVVRHEFDPGGRGKWFMPRCRICREFKEHPIHEGQVPPAQP